jgi:hypothetical protein
MSSRAWHTVSRRAALTGFAITAAYGSVVAEQVSDGTWGGDGAGSIFSPSGPNAELYGAAEGFPIADHSLAHQPGEPSQVKYRVGAYSHFDESYPTHPNHARGCPVDVQALASEYPLSFSRQSIVCDRVAVAQSCYRLTDRQGRPHTLRALPVWADRSRPADFSIDGEVDHRDADWDRYWRGRDQIGR